MLKTAIAKAGYTGKVSYFIYLNIFYHHDFITFSCSEAHNTILMNLSCLFCQVVIGMDVAASEFYDSKDKTYDLNFKEEVI